MSGHICQMDRGQISYVFAYFMQTPEITKLRTPWNSPWRWSCNSAGLLGQKLWSAPSFTGLLLRRGFTTLQTFNKKMSGLTVRILFLSFCQSSFKYVIIHYTHYTISGFTINIGEFE